MEASISNGSPSWQAGADLGVNGFFISHGNRTLNQTIGFLGHACDQAVIGEYDLGYTIVVTQIHEKHAAVVTDRVDPAGQLDILPDMIGVQLITGMSSQHSIFLQ